MLEGVCNLDAVGDLKHGGSVVLAECLNGTSEKLDGVERICLLSVEFLQLLLPHLGGISQSLLVVFNFLVQAVDLVADISGHARGDANTAASILMVVGSKRQGNGM